jgi:hypothetical protein
MRLGQKLLLLSFMVGGCSKPQSSSAPVPQPTEADASAISALPSAARFALLHVTVVDVAGAVEEPDRAVVVDGDRIVAVVAADAVPASPPARLLDARGKYIIPGLWDMHVHFADPSSAKLFIANGVTGVRVMWGNPPFAAGMERFHFDMRDAFDKKTAVGPRMLISSQILDGPRPIWPNSEAAAPGAEHCVLARGRGVTRCPPSTYDEFVREAEDGAIPRHSCSTFAGRGRGGRPSNAWVSGSRSRAGTAAGTCRRYR